MWRWTKYIGGGGGGQNGIGRFLVQYGRVTPFGVN